MAGSRLEFRLLGPLALVVDDAEVALGGPKQRALLALLLLNANRVVSRAQLVGEVFPEQSVNSADHALRNHVSRLRRILAPVADEPRIVARPPGFLLRVALGELDLERFESLLAQGRDALAGGDAALAASLLRDGDALWRGRALADLELEPFLRLEAERLEDLRLAALETRVDADLALGRHADVVAELQAVAAAHPYRERFRAQLMLALYQGGRQADGLALYRQTRALLNDELGLEPGAELQELERRILLQDPQLAVPARTATALRSPRAGECPFKGLAPFQPDDADLFFGRERLVDELVARLATTPLLAIIGPSGSGKSSLLRAGLLPQLAPYRRILIRPSERAASSLAAELESVPPLGRIVLAVDQFEEIFEPLVEEAERGAFIDQLVDASWDAERRVTVLLALRADFFGRIAPYIELADLVGPNHLLLPPLSPTELRRSVEGPASLAGVAVEPQLVDVLVADLNAAPGALPLLSTTLVDLWRDREGDRLTAEAYERRGGVDGAVGRHAESAFAALDAEGQETARSILLRLVTDDGTGTIARRRASPDELDLEDVKAARVVATLVERRLLVAGTGGFELVHEALVEQWPRLVEWLAADAEERRLQRQLSLAAADWDSRGRDNAYLYRGSRLVTTLDWLSSPGAASVLNRVERDFVAASRGVSSREYRRLRILLASAVTLLVAALVAGALALQARSSARAKARTATAERLGAQALVDPELDRALLLARQGVALDDSAATDGELLATMLRAPAASGVMRDSGTRTIDAALSPDGRTLAVRDDGGEIGFFDARDSRPIDKSFRAAGQIAYFGAVVRPYRALAFSPDGETLVVGDSDGESALVYLVDTRTHRARATVRSQANAVVSDVAFAPDGQSFVTAEPVSGRFSPPDVQLVRRRARDGAAERSSSPLSGGRLIGFARGGRAVLVSVDEQRAFLLDAATFRRLATFQVAGPVAAVAADGRWAAFASEDGHVTTVDLITGTTRVLGGSGPAGAVGVAIAPSGQTLATTSVEGGVTVWDVRTGALVETLGGLSVSAFDPTFSRDGTTLYTAEQDGSAVAWDLSRRRGIVRPFRFTWDEGASTALAVSPDSSRFVVSPRQGTVALWRVSDLRRLAELRFAELDATSLSWSADGTLVAASGSRVRAVVWDVRTHRVVSVLGRDGGASQVALSPRGNLVATAGVDGDLDVYDVRTGHRISRYVVQGTLQDVDFSSDGSRLVAAGLGGHIVLWDVGRRSVIRTIERHTLLMTSRFAPDGSEFATGDVRGNIEFWDADTGRAVRPPFASPNGGISSVTYDHTSRRIVATGFDGAVRLWDLGSRKVVGTPLEQSAVGGWGMFSPDGRNVVTVFGNGRGVVWDVDPADWASRACAIAARPLTRDEWAQFVPGTPYRPSCGG